MNSTTITVAAVTTFAAPANATPAPTTPSPAVSPRAQVIQPESSTGTSTPPPAAASTDPFSATVILTLILGSTVVGAVLATVLSNMRAAADRRRDRYSAAIAHLVAWHEYPYRIRRRTNDEPATLAALADRGHQLQEAGACHRAWIAGDSQPLAQVYDAWLRKAQRNVAPAAEAAWSAGPVTRAEQMNVGPIGDGDAHAASEALGTAVRYRFGLRRALPGRTVHRRLGELDLYPPDDAAPPADPGPPACTSPSGADDGPLACLSPTGDGCQACCPLSAEPAAAKC